MDVEPSGQKRSYTEMELGESESSESDEEQTEFGIYMSYKKQHGVKNPLDWWKTSEGMFPKMARMARDTYAVPATSSGVEREFSISGNIVNNRRNCLSPKAISDLMQYKRWLAKIGVMAKFLRDQGSTDIASHTLLSDRN